MTEINPILTTMFLISALMIFSFFFAWIATKIDEKTRDKKDNKQERK